MRGDLGVAAEEGTGIQFFSFGAVLQETDAVPEAFSLREQGDRKSKISSVLQQLVA
ncbi:hypothetical protein YSKK_27250 [Halopseudomonas aestusnigri]|nr:hypothetical protein YSKK_27250 [Halopseudomonas aestusnigri]